jgi:polar amino acid transport system substrate-binding protein
VLVKILATLLATFACTCGAAFAQSITVTWRDKPPFHYTENGIDKGPMLLRAKEVFALAGLDARFVKEPSKRIWANFQGQARNTCSFGWYHLEEREAWVRFSVAMQTDLPHSVVFAPDAQQAWQRHATLASLLADKSLVLGVVDGVSYGPELDALIRSSSSAVVRRTVDPAAMLRMTGAGRIDYMFIDRDDWDHARQREPLLRQALVRDYPDAPAGLQRYIVCSKDVEPEVMVRINRALEATVPRKTPEATAPRSRNR